MPQPRGSDTPAFVLSAGCSQEAVSLLRQGTDALAESPVVLAVSEGAQAHLWASLHRPDLIVIDVERLGPRALSLLETLRADPVCADIPVLAMVELVRADMRRAVLLAGATDVIAAPPDPYECRARVLNLIRLGGQQRRLAAQARRDPCGRRDLARHRERAREILRRFARARTYRREDVGARLGRIGRLSRAIAERLRLPRAQCELLELAAPMHDIGNIGIPDTVLHKDGPYTPEERRQMQLHTLIGHELLKDSSSPYLRCGAEIALAHHEKYDGTGYPYGLAGEGIPISARIVAVASVYDALATPRPSRPSWPSEALIDYLDAQRGRHFDPACVEALFAELAHAGL